MKTLVSLVFSVFMLASCGGGSDGGGDTNVNVNNPDEEEVDGSCLTVKQRSDITQLLTKLSDFPTITGATGVSERQADGTSLSAAFRSAYNFEAVDADSWRVITTHCPINEPSNCQSRSFLAEFKDGCFFVDGDRTKVTSSSTTSLRYTAKNPKGEDLDDTVSLRNDRLSIREVIRKGGVTQGVFLFEED